MSLDVSEPLKKRQIVWISEMFPPSNFILSLFVELLQLFDSLYSLHWHTKRFIKFSLKGKSWAISSGLCPIFPCPSKVNFKGHKICLVFLVVVVVHPEEPTLIGNRGMERGQRVGPGLLTQGWVETAWPHLGSETEQSSQISLWEGDHRKAGRRSNWGVEKPPRRR